MSQYPGNPYGVKNYRHFNGHDGQGFDASLYRDGKRIGTVSDDGWGGGYSYGIPREEMDALEAYAASLPLDDGLQPDTDMVVGDAMEDLFAEMDRKDVIKQLNRWSKTKTVFLLAGEDGDKDGYRTLGEAYGERTLAFLAGKYAGTGAVVWNPVTKSFDEV